MRITIRQLRTLIEAAIKPDDDDAKGLCLAITGVSDSDTSYILYDAGILRLIKNLKMKRKLSDLEMESCAGFMHGFIKTSPSPRGEALGARQVSMSAAIKGFGPMMYDIVMGIEGTLMADRGLPRPAAKNVWSYYLNKRKDVTAKRLDNIDDPKTPPKSDDAEVFDDDDSNPLNYAFSGASAAHNHLTANHTRVKSKIKGALAEGDKFEEFLDDVGHMFFTDRYNS